MQYRLYLLQILQDLLVRLAGTAQTSRSTPDNEPRFTRLSPRLRTWRGGFKLRYRVSETANEVRRRAWFGLEEVHGWMGWL